MTEPTPDIIELTVLVEDQAEVASALLEAAGSERIADVQAVTGGFLVPSDIAAAAGLIPSDEIGDVKVEPRATRNSRKAAEAAAKAAADKAAADKAAADAAAAATPAAPATTAAADVSAPAGA